MSEMLAHVGLFPHFSRFVIAWYSNNTRHREADIKGIFTYQGQQP